MKAFTFRDPMFVASLRPKAAATSTDPSFSNVKLLLHMDGANGGTTFTDSSSRNHTVTAAGNANTDTSVKKFGSASAEFDGSGDWLQVPDNDDWDIGIDSGYGASEFTVETWVYLNNTSGTQVFINKGGGTAGWNGSNGHQYVLFISGGSFYWQWWNGSSVQSINDTLTNLSWSASNWYHLAISHDGTTTSLYFNGSRVGTSTQAYRISTSATTFRIGGAVSSTTQSVNGYMDELRITKGTARYSGASIVVPTAPFPNS
ncbi:MAG: LamG domain-containing protein [Bacteroidetes bacterium]|jgi:hypothetical protein|nr:MAG: LamG domain-containing protein [Bacteroidota bacterium]